MRMKKFLITLILVASVVACGSKKNQSISTTKPKIVEPTVYGYVVKNVYPHSTNSYTQGLQFVDGVMWEDTGEYGSSQIVTYSLGDAEPKVLSKLPRSEFGEGITLLGNELYQITWESNICHVYDPKTMQKLRDFRYPGEGWGLTSDGEKLYMSDGTHAIRIINPATMKQERLIGVTLRGESLTHLNELEWIDGKIWANIYTTDYIAIINPENGVVEGVIRLSGLLPESERTPKTDVLNGIAYDAVAKRIFVTGKNWSRLYEIKLIAQ